MSQALIDHDAGTAEAAGLVDLDRYPMADLSQAKARCLIADCRDRLKATGVCLMPGFLTADATETMGREARSAARHAYFCENFHNAYLIPEDPSLPGTDARRRRLETRVGSVAYDRIPPTTALRALYDWDPLAEFIGAVLDRRPLYRLADPLGALSINVFRPGDKHAWHFDEAEYTTTIMLQEAERGGDFEYVPSLRTEDDNNAAGVGRILDGEREGVLRLPMAPGSLLIFAGRTALHRVTRVAGDRLRLVAVLCYNARPGVTNSETVRRLFWGRAR